MSLYKNKYRIESSRLKKWDYSAPGHYFITICTKDRKCLFGNVTRGKMILSEMGKIAEQYWREIPDHFNHVKLDEFVVMPNHIHGIITIVEMSKLDVSTGINHDATKIGIIINQYKRICTIRIRASNPGISIWQTRYHDHIIRDEYELDQIRQYIINNPLNWNKNGKSN